MALKIYTVIFWVKPCSLAVNDYLDFLNKCCLLANSTLKMKEAGYSETVVTTYETELYRKPENWNLYLIIVIYVHEEVRVCA
jgi:hypothetical protein